MKNRLKLVASITALSCVFLVFFKAKTEAPMIAGFMKSDIEEVLTLTGLTYNGTIDDLVAVTQKGWLRPAHQERWEIQEHPYEKKRDQLLPIFVKMGLVNAVDLKKTSYDHILFMGATVFSMHSRMEKLKEVLSSLTSYHAVALLSGCRYLIESEREFLEKRGWTNLPEIEADALKRLFEESLTFSDKVILINSPQKKSADGVMVRPTTVDTVEDWLKTNPKEGTVLVISSQPFCHYQKIVTESLLPCAFSVDVVGRRAPENTTMAVYLDMLARTFYQWSKSVCAQKS